MSNILKTLSLAIVLAVSFVQTPLLAQEKYAKEYEKAGDKSMEKHEYQQALDYYMLGRKFLKQNLTLMYKCGEACLAMKDYDKAEFWYQKVLIENDTTDINQTYPLLYLHLAQASISNGNIIQAQSFLNTCLLDCNDIEIRKQCKNELAKIDWIIDNDTPMDFTITNLGKNINNEASQLNTFVLKDSIIFFTTPEYKTNTKNGQTYYTDIYNQIYYSYIDEDYYTPANKLEWGDINKKKTNCSDFFFDTLTATVYYTQTTEKKGKNISNIYFSTFSNGKWSKPEAFKPTYSKDYSSTHPVIARYNNEVLMYFASDREGGYGKMDIWYIDMKNTNDIPKNLGSTINTNGNEITPFYFEDEEELYFSSDTHKGFGGFDIFRSVGWRERWTQAENLKQPINSPANDLYPFIIDSDNDGYFTSNRPTENNKDNKTCCNDLYRFSSNLPDEPTMSTIINKMTGFNPATDLPLSLYFHNDSPDAGSESATTDLSYQDCYKLYNSLSNQYKASRTKGLDDSLANAEIKAIDDFMTNKLKKGYDKLNEICEYILDKLQDNKNITIQIRGYCSSLFETNYNFNLAERRINSVENYFRKWNDGVLLQYMDETAEDGQKKLAVQHLAIGKLESTSPNPTTLAEKRQSVFLDSSMQERRIEIKVIQVRE
ncbi:MAG: PD40 domain-containing protein [Bacteroidales bacterium]|nr:PD40 domain-containing protein [Bacteroidales bacterium]